MPESVHVPAPVFVREVAKPVLSTIAPPISPVPAVEPCRVRLLLPSPAAVLVPVNFSKPLVPDVSIIPPPVVPLRLNTLLVVSPAPVYSRVALVEPLPRLILPVPRLPLAPALPRFETLVVPAPRVVPPL